MAALAPPDAPADESAPLFHLQELFLEHYREHGLLTAAAELAGVPQRSVARWQQQPAFAAAFAEAQAVYRDAIRREIKRRAMEGWDEPVYQRGALVGHVRKYSDGLLTQMAKTLLPEFKEQPAAPVNVNVLNQVVAWREKTPPVPADPVVIDVPVRE